MPKKIFLILIFSIPYLRIPDFGIRLLQTQVSIGRIESFLKEEEVANYAKDEIRSEFNLTKSTTKLGFKENASFKWSGSDNWKLDLGDIEFPEGKLSIIQGPTGSGKSSCEFLSFSLNDQRS